jgi:hypothetical protein
MATPAALMGAVPISVLTDSYKASHFLQYPDAHKMVAVRPLRVPGMVLPAAAQPGGRAGSSCPRTPPRAAAADAAASPARPALPSPTPPPPPQSSSSTPHAAPPAGWNTTHPTRRPLPPAPAAAVPQYGEFRCGFNKDATDTRLVAWGMRYLLDNYISQQWTEEDVERADLFYK